MLILRLQVESPANPYLFLEGLPKINAIFLEGKGKSICENNIDKIYNLIMRQFSKLVQIGDY